MKLINIVPIEEKHIDGFWHAVDMVFALMRNMKIIF